MYYVEGNDAKQSLRKCRIPKVLLLLESSSATWDDAKGEMYWDDGDSNDGIYAHWTFEFRAQPMNATLKIRRTDPGNVVFLVF